jgi:hypothetical protein
MIPDIRHPDIDMMMYYDPDIGGTPILIPLSGRSDIGYQNSNIGPFISDIRCNIWYKMRGPDIGYVTSDIGCNFGYYIGDPDIGLW